MSQEARDRYSVEGVTQQSYETVDAVLMNGRAYAGEVTVCCTEARGSLVDFVACPEVEPGTWVGVRRERYDGPVGDGWITDENTVRETVRLCLPDVELVEFDNSLFTESEG